MRSFTYSSTFHQSHNRQQRLSFSLRRFNLITLINLTFFLLNMRSVSSFICHGKLFGEKRVCLYSNIFRQTSSTSHPSTSIAARPDYLDMEDVLLSGLNQKQDISVKVVSCREAVQEAMIRKSLTLVTARALGETMACSLLMGSGLKGEETLQVNLVGTDGMKNVMVITDGSLKVKGMVGDPDFNLPTDVIHQINGNIGCFELMGSQGQVQVVRNHPSWKHAMNGIVSLKDMDIATNLALYLTESEQRAAVLLTDVKISDDNKCEHALAILVESLPGVEESNLEVCISNVQKVQNNGLSSYLTNFLSSDANEDLSKSIIPVGPISLRMEEVLHRILDDCFQGMSETEGPRGDGIRFAKTPKFVCQCNFDRVYRALSLLPKQDIDEIMEEGKDVESKCGFCGKAYSVSVKDLSNHLAQSNVNDK